MNNLQKFIFRNINFSVSIIVLYLLISLLPSASFANEEKIFQLDYANFKGADTSYTYLEIYCQFSNADLHFVKNDSGYLARIELIAVLYDEAGAYIAESAISQSPFESFYSLTTSETEKRTVQFNFNVAPGSYTMHLLFTDKVTDYTFENKMEIKARRFSTNELAFSDIEVASRIERMISDSVKVKDGQCVIAHPSRIFGDVHLKANFYFEIYNPGLVYPDSSCDYFLEYTIRDRRGESVQKFSENYAAETNRTPLSFSVDVQKYKPGKYTLDLEVLDKKFERTTKAQTDFTVVEPPKDLPLARYDRVLNVLNLIVKEKAVKSEVEEKSEKSVMALKLTKDNQPQANERDVQDQFHQRVAYANRAFAALGKPGWKTDRGKIFIQYGKPDRVKKSKGMYGEKIEVWIYFQKELDFMFVDRQGMGDFILIQNGQK